MPRKGTYVVVKK